MVDWCRRKRTGPVAAGTAAAGAVKRHGGGSGGTWSRREWRRDRCTKASTARRHWTRCWRRHAGGHCLIQQRAGVPRVNHTADGCKQKTSFQSHRLDNIRLSIENNNNTNTSQLNQKRKKKKKKKKKTNGGMKNAKADPL